MNNRWMSDIDRTLADIAADQGGVFTVRQAVSAGISRSALRRRAQRGGAHRRHPGTYFLGFRARTVDGERWAAVLAGGPDAMLDGRAAAQEWGLIRGADAPPEILVGRRQRPLSGVVCRFSSTTHDEDRAEIRGRPTVSAERALVTLAATFSVPALGRCLREGTINKVVDLDRLRRTMARNPRRAGARRLREALDRFLDGDGGADNRHEARFASMLHRDGETSAQCNVTLTVQGVQIRPDIWLRDDGVAIELDEWSHGIPQVSREDRLKVALLESASIPTIRIDQNDLPGGMHIVREALRRIRWERSEYGDQDRHGFAGNR